jgi:hypothetical protein
MTKTEDLPIDYQDRYYVLDDRRYKLNNLVKKILQHDEDLFDNIMNKRSRVRDSDKRRPGWELAYGKRSLKDH